MECDESFVPMLLHFLESPSLSYTLLGSWASPAMTHCEQPGAAAGGTSTGTHAEGRRGSNTSQRIFGQLRSVAALPTFQEANQDLSICW